MTELFLTQEEADALIALEKHRVDSRIWNYPALDGSLTVPLKAASGNEEFLLDVRRGRIDLQKCTFQNRGRKIIVLLRLDTAGPPHRNPDGQVIPCPHLHVYREGFADKWAYPLPDNFSGITDQWQLLVEFMNHCNITLVPIFHPGLLK